jgi:intein/homing endonuclease
LIPKYYQKNNYWRVDFGNKIIYRYMEKIFEIPVGKKHEKVKIPKVIEQSSLKFKKAFLQGLFIFDGGLGKSYFNFCTKGSVNLLLV